MNVTNLMHQLLERWLTIILESTEAAVAIAFENDAEERLKSARTIFARSPDAAGDGRGEPGNGGYLHGYYRRVALPPMILALKHITDWKAPAAHVNILVAARLAGKKAMLRVQVDALLAPYVISKRKSSSADIQHMTQELIVRADHDAEITARLPIGHLSGDGDFPSDLTSRALWAELSRLCELSEASSAASEASPTAA